MLEHTKRQVKVFLLSTEMRLYFLMFITAACFLFLLRLIFWFFSVSELFRQDIGQISTWKVKFLLKIIYLSI